MELILERIAKRKTYTIGRLYIRRQVMDEYLPGIEDQYFCDTLEPTWRDYANGAYKVKGRSAIPEGRYAVVISFSPKFKQWLPILLGVPKFEREKAEFTSASEREQGRPEVNREVGKVLDSRIWVHRLKQKIVEAKGRGESVWITIK